MTVWQSISVHLCPFRDEIESYCSTPNTESKMTRYVTPVDCFNKDGNQSCTLSVRYTKHICKYVVRRRSTFRRTMDTLFVRQHLLLEFREMTSFGSTSCCRERFVDERHCILHEAICNSSLWHNTSH